MCTQNQAIKILEEVYNSCNPIFNNAIKDAYLYGSYARGDYHTESDVDILLTVDMSSAEIAKFRNAVATVTSDLSLSNDITVSVTVKPLAQFIQYSDILPYYKNVIKEGIRYAVKRTKGFIRCKIRTCSRML